MAEIPRIDLYADLNSPVHLWDARAKIASMLALIVSIAFVSDISAALLGLFFTLLMLYVSKIPASFILRYLKCVAPFVLFLFIALLVSVPGKELLSFYFLSVSYEGLIQASLIATRSFSAVILLFTLLATARFDHTIKALEKLGVHNKLVQILLFTYRYIFLLTDGLHAILRSLKSRGFQPKTGIFNLKVLGTVIGMLFVRSYERAEQVYNAMVSRGYSGVLKTQAEFRMIRSDWLKSSLVVFAAILLHGFVYF